MQTLTRHLLEAGLSDRILTDFQLSRLIEGSNQRRYNLVNRAMESGELVRLRRGLYILSEKYRSFPCHPYAVAQMLVPGSYVSLETALSYHGWIPEAVFSTTSILPGRRMKQFNHEQMGLFTFHPLAIQKGYFLELVERVQLNGQGLLVASPIRALMDLVCFRKLEWQGLSWLEQGVRIDDEALRAVVKTDLQALKQVYQHKRVQHYLDDMGAVLNLEARHD